jgi:plastocyanin
MLRLSPLAVVLPVLALLAAAAPAHATLKRVVVRQGPLTVNPYEVRYTSRSTRSVEAPGVDGYIVRMHARVVDAAGRPIPVQRVMLHHIVYKTKGRRDPVCGGAQSFYGTGEENESLSFPPGYGYRIHRRDRWITGWMLMNHRSVTDRAYIEYTAWVETSRRLRAVTPYWIRATACRGARDPIFNVPGGGPSGSLFRQSASWRAPRSGVLVAGGAHLHGGAYRLELREPACRGRPLMVSRALYGLPDHPYYQVRPVLHEPGPIATSWVTSASGIPVRRGERLRVTAVYDGSRPHTRVMGIWHVYLAHGRASRRRCAPLPRDTVSTLPGVPGRTKPPATWLPLTALDENGKAIPIDRPAGPVAVGGERTRVVVADRSYSIRNLSIPVGASVNWRFTGSGFHDVTLVSGPVGFASRWSVRGQEYTRRFDVPGAYRVYCSLHPVDMTQAIDVKLR